MQQIWNVISFLICLGLTSELYVCYSRWSTNLGFYFLISVFQFSILRYISCLHNNILPMIQAEGSTKAVCTGKVPPFSEAPVCRQRIYLPVPQGLKFSPLISCFPLGLLFLLWIHFPGGRFVKTVCSQQPHLASFPCLFNMLFVWFWSFLW